MSKSNDFEADIIAHIFNATALPSDYNGPYYLALHTADPGEAGTATTSEISYTSYARVSVARSSSIWQRSSNVVSNIAAVTWPKCTGGSGTATHFSLVTSSSGAGKILYKGAFAASLAISNNVTPRSGAGVLTFTDTGRGNTFTADLLDFIFMGTALPSTYNGPFYVALCTADAGAGGSPNTNEVSYTGYARPSAARTSGGWTCSGGLASNAALLGFGACTAGSGTATHYSIVTSSSGSSGVLMYRGTLTSSLAISAGITPEAAIGDIDNSED